MTELEDGFLPDDGCHPYVGQDERPEAKHPRQPDGVVGHALRRCLPGQSHDKREEHNNHEGGNGCLRSGHETEEVRLFSTRVSEDGEEDEKDEGDEVRRPHEDVPVESAHAELEHGADEDQAESYDKTFMVGIGFLPHVLKGVGC